MEPLKNYPIRFQQDVVWGDMDAFQHVNNTVFFRYFEDSRMAYFEKAGVMEFMQESGKGPILASTQCRFKAPVSYPDRLTLAGRVETMGSDRFVMKYLVFSDKLQRIVAEGEGIVVYYDYQASMKCDIPSAIREAIVTLESECGNQAGGFE